MHCEDGVLLFQSEEYMSFKSLFQPSPSKHFISGLMDTFRDNKNIFESLPTRNNFLKSLLKIYLLILSRKPKICWLNIYRTRAISGRS